MRNQMQAIALGSIGLLLASPVPRRVLTAVSPARSTTQGDVYRQGADNAWMGFVSFAPYVQIAGLVLLAVAVVVLVAKAGDATFRRPIAARPLQYVLAVVLSCLGVAMAFANPPSVTLPTRDIAATAGRIHGGVTGAQAFPEPPAQTNTAAPAPSGYTGWDSPKK